MKSIIAGAIAVLAFGYGPASAQPANCTGSVSSPARHQSLTNLQLILPANCACSDSGNPQQWNETHQGGSAGSIWERGTTIGGLSAANSIGTYDISQTIPATTIGVVGYTYGSTTYTYSVAAIAVTAVPPVTVRFCQRSNTTPFALNGISYVVKLKPGQCPPFPC